MHKKIKAEYGHGIAVLVFSNCIILSFCHNSISSNDLRIVTLLEIAAVSFRLMVIDIHTGSSFVSSFGA